MKYLVVLIGYTMIKSIIKVTRSPDHEFKCTHIPSCTVPLSIPTIACIDMGLFE